MPTFYGLKCATCEAEVRFVERPDLVCDWRRENASLKGWLSVYPAVVPGGLRRGGLPREHLCPACVEKHLPVAVREALAERGVVGEVIEGAEGYELGA